MAPDGSGIELDHEVGDREDVKTGIASVISPGRSCYFAEQEEKKQGTHNINAPLNR